MYDQSAGVTGEVPGQNGSHDADRVGETVSDMSKHHCQLSVGKLLQVCQPAQGVHCDWTHSTMNAVGPCC